ncbi:MAG: MaoC family dehydratase [Roseibium sp.]
MRDALCFEDFEPGQSYDLGSLEVSRSDIIEFASEFDPQPFHMDDTAGTESLLGGLAASGWHTCGLVMRLLATGLLNRSTCQGSPGIARLKWLKPVFPNDTLIAEARIVGAKELRSKPDLGLVTVEVTARNQANASILYWENAILFRRRKAA